jgi:Secretion system C-terminal sorting domain
MKNKYLLFSLIGIISIVSITFFTQWSKKEMKYIPRDTQEVTSYQIDGAMEWMNNRLVNANGEIDPVQVMMARKQAKLLAQQKAGNMNWTEMGPDNVAGRTRAILIDKDTHSTMYAGGVGGGLWKSTTSGQSWVQINDLQENISISCIAQDPSSGAIYVGTGEGFAQAVGTANGSSGFIGGGVYKSTDGINFTAISSTVPPTNVTNNTWTYTYEMACDASGGIYVCTLKGLMYSNDGGTSWANPVIYPSTNPFTAPAHDVEIASDGTIIAVVGNKVFKSPSGGTGTFTLSHTGLPTAGRIEIAIAPSDPNYIYANVASGTGGFSGVYQSTDKGANWTVIGPGGSGNFQVFGGNSQGKYDNEIAVFPNDKEHILVGGVDMWEGYAVSGATQFSWTQKSLWALSPTSSLYLHADQHKYVFHPTNPDKIYFGTDGGIHLSTDGGNSFQLSSINYNTIQFYTLAVSGQGAMMGGTQDNGTQLIDLQGNTTMNAVEVRGGDGGWCAFSYINPDIIFASIYYGNIHRSPDFGANFTGFYNDVINNMSEDGNGDANVEWDAAFVPPLALWESINDTTSNEYVKFVAEQNYNAGDVITATSGTNTYPINYTLTSALNSGDSIMVKDVVQSMFFVGFNNSVWMTRDALDFTQPKSDWFKIGGNSNPMPDSYTGEAQCMTTSTDGNYLFVGTTGGRVYRFSNLLMADDENTADVSSSFCIVETKLITTVSNRAITSIAVDPNDPSHIIITAGNYGYSQFVYESTNATDASPSFAQKQGNLPDMPVYASIIEMSDPNKVIIGTELGVFSTDNISAASPIWAAEITNGLATVPVYFLVQQTKNWPGVTNWGSIYAATHGRGFFKSDDYLGVDDNQQDIVINNRINIYPNPVVSFTTIAYQLLSASDINIRVFDIHGRLVFSKEESKQSVGTHQVKIDCNDFSRGTYIVHIAAGSTSTTGKFIVL